MTKRKNGTPITQLPTPAIAPPKHEQDLKTAKSFVLIMKMPDGAISFASNGNIDELIGLHRLAALDIERTLLRIQATQQPPQPLIVPGTFIR